MASIKYTAFVNEVKGKISGSVMQGGYGGSVIKGKDKKGTKSGGGKLTHADAGRLINSQANVSKIATAWRALSEADRLSWSSMSPAYEFKNRFGENYTASGFQLYMQCNLNLLSVGLSMLTVAKPPVPIGVMSTEFHVPGLPRYYWGWEDFTNNGYCTCEIAVTPPLPIGWDPGNSTFRVIMIVPGVMPVDPINLEPAILASRGSIPANSQIWVKMTPIVNTTGQRGIPIIQRLAMVDEPL